jgi:ferredoxin
VYVIVDRDKCTALGICESIAPGHFEVDDSGDLVVLRDDVGPDETQTLQEAVDACPTVALRLSAERR